MTTKPKDQMDLTLTVSYAEEAYAFAYSGEDVDSQGNIVVDNPKNHPVRLAFTLVRGSGVEDVNFSKDAKQAILVGEKDRKDCPPKTTSKTFDDEKHDKKAASIRNKKDEDGQFQYALFLVARRNGTDEPVIIDPVIVNR